MNYADKYRWFYQTKEWQAVRDERKRLANGLCEECLKKGIIEQGVEVHHIIPIEKDWDKRLDLDNTILLCRECHNKKHNRYSRFEKFLENFDIIDNNNKDDLLD